MDSFVVGKDSRSLEQVKCSLHTREVCHKAPNSSIENQAPRLVVTGVRDKKKLVKRSRTIKI